MWRRWCGRPRGPGQRRVASPWLHCNMTSPDRVRTPQGWNGFDCRNQNSQRTNGSTLRPPGTGRRFGKCNRQGGCRRLRRASEVRTMERMNSRRVMLAPTPTISVSIRKCKFVELLQRTCIPHTTSRLEVCTRPVRLVAQHGNRLEQIGVLTAELRRL